MKFYVDKHDVRHRKTTIWTVQGKTVYGINTKWHYNHPDKWEKLNGSIAFFENSWEEINLETVVKLLEYEKLYATKPKRNVKTGKRITRVTRSASK